VVPYGGAGPGVVGVVFLLSIRQVTGGVYSCFLILWVGVRIKVSVWGIEDAIASFTENGLMQEYLVFAEEERIQEKT